MKAKNNKIASLVMYVIILIVVMATIFVFYSSVNKGNQVNGDEESSIFMFLQKNAPTAFDYLSSKTLEQRQNEVAEKKRQSEKIIHDQIVLEKKPKFLRLSFFFGAPYRGSISVPAEWNGRYRAEEVNRVFDIVYATSTGITNKLLSVLLLNNSEWLDMSKQGEYKVLEKKSDLIFVYREYSSNLLSKGEASEYKKMQESISDVIKSFKGQSNN